MERTEHPWRWLSRMAAILFLVSLIVVATVTLTYKHIVPTPEDPQPPGPPSQDSSEPAALRSSQTPLTCALAVVTRVALSEFIVTNDTKPTKRAAMILNAARGGTTVKRSKYGCVKIGQAKQPVRSTRSTERQGNQSQEGGAEREQRKSQRRKCASRDGPVGEPQVMLVPFTPDACPEEFMDAASCCFASIMNLLAAENSPQVTDKSSDELPAQDGTSPVIPPTVAMPRDLMFPICISRNNKPAQMDDDPAKTGCQEEDGRVTCTTTGQAKINCKEVIGLVDAPSLPDYSGSGLFWYCGEGEQVRATLDKDWDGICAPVMFPGTEGKSAHLLTRSKREAWETDSLTKFKWYRGGIPMKTEQNRDLDQIIDGLKKFNDELARKQHDLYEFRRRWNRLSLWLPALILGVQVVLGVVILLMCQVCRKISCIRSQMFIPAARQHVVFATPGRSTHVTVNNVYEIQQVEQRNPLVTP